MSDSLNVFYCDQHVGVLFNNKGSLSFLYDAAYLKTENPTPLSVSLPLRDAPFGNEVSYAYFSGLLPEESVRRWLARYLHVSEGNVFGLLKEIGGECAGAVSLYPEGEGAESYTGKAGYRLLTEAQADEMLSRLETRPFMVGEDGVRISGAGAQSKMMVAFVEGQMALPVYGMPSSHIIKPAVHGFEETVHNEFFCMRLAGILGLPVPETAIHYVAEKPYYLVARYDRVKQGGVLTRLHQEDFCQALGLPPNQKYQNEGGPDLAACFSLLAEKIAEGAMPGQDRLTLLRGVIFNYLIGNGDAHGKNFSFLYNGQKNAQTKGQAVRLAPFYDLMCTLVYGELYKSKMAMKIGSKYRFHDMSFVQFDHLAKIAGVSPSFVRKQLIEMGTRIGDEAAKLAFNFNQNHQTASPIYQNIIDIIRKNAAFVEHRG
ncbi:MAG: type II toxin-antitoxin system HipA family toxin [Bdellovibrionales bacterium]